MVASTYLLVWFNSEGRGPSEVTTRLMSLGFKPTKGNYDYIYKWDNHAQVEDVLRLGDKVHQTLKGLNVLYKLETV